jgi:hypothetical protein
VKRPRLELPMFEEKHSRKFMRSLLPFKGGQNSNRCPNAMIVPVTSFFAPPGKPNQQG